MKKIVGTIAAIALATSAAFAEVNVGMGFNRGVFAPLVLTKAEGSDANFYMANSASWGWGGPRIGISFSAGSEQVGVAADVKFDGGNVAVNDNAYIWVKPVSWFTAKLGQTFDDTLRSGAAYGSWDLFRAGTCIRGDDAIFKRLGAIGSAAGKDESAPLTGLILMLDPIEGLHIAAGLPIAYATGSLSDLSTYENVFTKMQVQVGYTVANVLQIKAQWIGQGKTGDRVDGMINAAVCVKAVEDMNLDFGFFMGTAERSDITVTAFWGMPIGAVKLNANAEVVIPGNSNDKLALTAGAGVGFDLGSGMNIGADFRYSQKFVENSKAAMEVGGWFTKGIANGSISIGVQALFNDYFNGVTGTSPAAATEMQLAIPIMVQCFF